MLYIGSGVSEKMRDTLRKMNIPFAVMPDNPDLASPLASHPDMSAVRVCGRMFSTGKAAEFFDCTDTGESFGECYPDDVLFNGFTLCGKLFCYEKAFSRAVIEFAKGNGVDTANVKQGYAKCSTLVLGDNGIITADKGIANAAKPFCRVLLIECGGISLPPYEYGFIGGASFIIGDKVFFFGDVSGHKNAKEILNFISDCGFSAVSLSDEPLCDCGGGILTDE